MYCLCISIRETSTNGFLMVGISDTAVDRKQPFEERQPVFAPSACVVNVQVLSALSFWPGALASHFYKWRIWERD